MLKQVGAFLIIDFVVCPNVNAKFEKKAGCAGYVWTGSLLVGLLATVSFCVQPSEEEKASEEQAGFHCLNYYSGALTDLEDAVKSSLRDPSSYEHISTRVTPIRGDKTHAVLVEYRARNGFGGYAIARAAGRYANSDCKLLEWHTSPK